MTVLLWTEYRTETIPHDDAVAALGKALYAEFPNFVGVEFPSPKTGGAWQFTPQGWVGSIPVTETYTVSIQPKAPLINLFRMWEVAYRLTAFQFLDGVINCDSLADFFQNLAKILVARVLDRMHRGLYREYLGRRDSLPYVSGRLDIRRLASEPWRVGLDCDYEEHTADVEDNHIIVWTLSEIARSGLCCDGVLIQVRKAYRGLLGCVTPQPISPQACIGRLYNRLNEDYQPLHGLCRFFLELRCPSHQRGDRTMTPFLMNMAQLFELFIAEWLRLHLPDEYGIRPQYNLSFGGEGELRFRMDAVLEEKASGKRLCVLDTKYKTPDAAGNPDIHEIRSYAESIGCTETALIYPVDLLFPLDVTAGKIRTRSLTFRLDGDLDAAGKAFLQQLLQGITA